MREKDFSLCRMKVRTAVVYLILFSGGLALGLSMNRVAPPGSSKPSFEQERKPSADEIELVRLRSDNSALHRELQELRINTEQASREAQKALTLKRLSALIESKKDIGGAYLVPFLDYKGEIDELFAQIFDLTPEERANISSTVASARAAINKLEVDNTKVRRIGPDKVELSIEPFATDGGKVYDEAVAQLAKTLGPERYAAFLKTSGDLLDSSIGSFGAMARTMTITEKPGAFTRFELNEQTRSTNSSGTSQSQFRDEAELRAYLKNLGPLYPSR